MKNRKGQIGQLPNFFKIMMLVVIFAGLTFIVLDKFVDVSYKPTITSITNEKTAKVVNTTGINLTAYTSRDCSATITLATNASNATKIILSTNYTVIGCNVKAVSNADPYSHLQWNITYDYGYNADTSASNAVNKTSNDLYDYGIGFLGIVMLVVMVYLIISIVSGRKSGAR